MARIAPTRNLGMIALALWLILYGLAGFLTVTIPSIALPALAIIAGVLILVGR